jgi:hypothetical protein
MEDGIWQGAAFVLVVVDFRFHGLVDVGEVAEGLPRNTDDTDMALLMPHLEEAANAILVIAPLDAVLRSPSPNCKG